MLALLGFINKLANWAVAYWKLLVATLIGLAVVIREWLVVAIQQSWLNFLTWVWPYLDSFGLTDYFSSFGQLAQIVGDYTQFAVWLIPVVPVVQLVLGAYYIAWIITITRHVLGWIPTLNAG